MKRILVGLFLMYSAAVWAQTGPGGVGNALGVGQPRNVLWLDATTLGLTDGVNITSWPDRSGNANNLSTTAAISPLFENTVPVNGLGYARFSKADNRIVITSFGDMPQSAYTMVIVYRTGDTGKGLISYAASNASPDEYLLRNSDALRTYITGTFDQSSIAINNNTFRALVTSWENIDGILDYYVDGNEGSATLNRTVNGFKIGQTLQSGGTLAIGNDQDLLNDGYEAIDAFAGDIAEVIIYDRKLNAMQVRIVNNYIRAKYNLSLANNNYAGSGIATPSGEYDFNVMGVGRLSGATHNEANSAGFILTGNTYSSTNTFVFAGHNNLSNSAVATSLGTGVQQRWNRSWYMDFTNNLTVDATFDLGEGIGGGSPVNKDNYVLLRWNGTQWANVGIANTSKTINGDRISFRIVNTGDTFDGRYTLGTLDAVASPVAGINIRTWYSYQTGSWNNPAVWTLDGGVVPLLTNPGNEIPQPSDNVVITNGRTVTMNINSVTLAGIRVDGTLNLAASSGHNFNTIEGNGRIRLSGAANADNFPAGTTTNFADAINGGTVEYYGSGNISLNQNRTLNNVEVKFTGASTSCFLMSDFVINGELRVETGTFQFNDGVSTVNRNLTVGNHVTIESTGSIKTGSAGGIHQFNLQANLINNGGVLELTNYVTADYATVTPTSGAVNANFISALQDQELICNGASKFWRIKIDKGLDDTYKLRITADNVSNFNLLGYAGHDNDGDLTTNNNALGLIRGTVEIGDNIQIPVVNNVGNYSVYSTAALWINGGSVTKSAGEAIVVYGKARVTTGTLNANVNSGVTLRINGTLEVEGGTVNANQIRTSVLGVANIGGYIQTGGTVFINPGAASINNEYYTFSMTYPGNVFRMGGGTLTIRRTSTNTDRGIVFINSDPQNVSVTGGTIILELSTNSSNYAITSRAPFWNLTLRKTITQAQTFKLRGGSSGTASTLATLVAQPLVVLNSLTIENSTFAATLDAQGIDVELGKDFIINNGATYTTGTNTTKFTGTANGILNLGGAARTFNNFYFEKSTSTAQLDIQNGLASPAIALTINGTLSAIRGNLLYGTHLISGKGNVVNTAVVGSPVPAATGRIILDGSSAQTISSDNGTFHNLELNNASGINLTTGTLNVARTLTMTAGIFNIGVNKLTLQGVNAAITNTVFGVTKMIQTAGNASDGGLEMYFNANETIVYPIGTNANAVVRYTPATVQTQSLIDDGYIRINIEDNILQTTNLSAGADILSYNWRVAHSGFSTLPRVSYQFTYDNTDIGGTEATYVPGKVLAVSPFTRSTDGGINDVNTASNIIIFNGTDTGGIFPGAGFPVESAHYTAGISTRFSGTPRVFYTREFSPDGWNVDWRTSSFWTFGTNLSFGKHDSRQTPVTAGLYPQAGDIAVIGWVPFGDPAGNNGSPHGISLNRTEQFAELVFTQMLNASNNPTSRVYASNFQFRPTLVINNLGGGNVGQIGSNATVSGEGAFWIRSTGGDLSDPTFAGVDVGFFSQQDSSYFIYENTLGAANYNNGPSVYPNLMMATDGWGNQDKSSTITKNITVEGDLELLGNVNLVLNTGANGNITVNRNLRFFRSNARGNDSGGGGELRFGNTGTSRTITVLGNLLLGNGFAADVRILSPDGSPITHTFNLYGNFVQNTTSGSGFKAGTNSANDRIHLNLLGSVSMTLSSAGGDNPQFYSFTVNKGSNTATTATVTTAFTLDGPTNALPKVLELRNGLLILNNPGININLTTGNGDFSIPSSTGLQITQGQVNVSGTNTGILLDGLIRINGGIVNMDDPVNGGNNYIEYSASGNAQLEISSGGLIVGSQIRRGLTSTAGVLKYIQTGGTVTVAKNAASQTNRGVFEIVNAGSRFTYTGGSLTIVQGINSAFVPSILIETTSYSFTNTQILTIGSINSPANTNIKNIGIKTNQIFGGLTLDNSSGNEPLVKLYSSPINIAGPLTINTGCIFNAQGFDVTLRHNFVNNGAYIASGNKLILNPSTTRTISGNGTFDIYKMDKVGANQIVLGTSLIVNNELKVLSGTIATSTNFLVAKQNVVFDGNATSTGGLGLVFEGTSKQILSRTENTTTSSLSILTIRNSSGVEIPDGQGYKFTITSQLRLESGIFDVGGNLLLFTTTGSIIPVSPFSVGNMIRTNSSFSDSGVRKVFSANHITDFIFPVGQAHYTPVTFNFGSPGRTSGSTSPTITVRTAEEPHPSIIEDAESPDPEIVDINNVLQYYYTIDADNVNAASFKVDAILKYDPAYVAVTAPYTELNYITASIFEDNNPTESINKSSGIINTASKTLTFTFSGVSDDLISGDYFAGIDTAIPDNVPVYQTIASGDITNPLIFSPQPPSIPNGAIVIVNAGHELDFNVNSVRLYKTIISTGSVLDIDETYGHRLGIVFGTGTLKITSNTESAVIPAGFYENFFGCSGGSLEFAGTGAYDIMGGITQVRNLTVSGGGQRLLANNDLHVCQDFVVTGPSMLNSNNRAIRIDNDLNLISGSFNKSNGSRTLTVGRDINVSGGTFASVSGGDRLVARNVIITGGTFHTGSGGILSIGGNLGLSGGTFTGGSGTVKILMNGSSTQNINGNFTGASQIHRLEISNAFGLNLGGNVDINTELLLTNGLINPSTNQFRLNSSATVNPVNGSAASYVNGRMYKILNAGASFSFPIGKANRWRYTKVNSVSTGGLTWYAEYYIGNVDVLEPIVDNQLSSDPSIVHVSGGEYWKVSDNTSATPDVTAQIGLSWGIESDVSANAPDRESLKVMVWNDAISLWDNYGGANFLAGHTQSRGDFNSVSNVSFSEQIITLGTNNLANALPVELTDFKASVTPYNTVLLEWVTKTETNNERFEIERSQDGFDYTYVDQLRGAGTTKETHKYMYVDEAPFKGTSYYRLKQVDFDGTFTYSKPKMVKVEGREEEPFVAYPNPVDTRLNPIVNFSREGKFSIVIYNNMNQPIRTYHAVDSFDATGLAAGLYIIRNQLGETFKLIVK